MCTGSLIGAAVGNDLAAWAPIDALRIVLVAPRRVIDQTLDQAASGDSQSDLGSLAFSLPGDPVMAIQSTWCDCRRNAVDLTGRRPVLRLPSDGLAAIRD